jgi:hypothetical protein
VRLRELSSFVASKWKVQWAVLCCNQQFGNSTFLLLLLCEE